MEVSFKIEAPATLSPREEPRVGNGQEGWVGSIVGLDAVEKRKILSCWDTNPSRPGRSYTVWAIPVPVQNVSRNINLPILALTNKTAELIK
jgi:hypothetical protein